MEDLIQRKTVTYEWWFCFNLRLSILATPSERRLSNLNLTSDTLKALITSGAWKDHDNTVKTEIFSKIDSIASSVFLFPTTLGIISIDDMNKIFATKVWTIGLVNKPLLKLWTIIHMSKDANLAVLLAN